MTTKPIQWPWPVILSALITIGIFIGGGVLKQQADLTDAIQSLRDEVSAMRGDRKAREERVKNLEDDIRDHEGRLRKLEGR